MRRTRDQVIADCIRTGEVQFEPDLIPALRFAEQNEYEIDEQNEYEIEAQIEIAHQRHVRQVTAEQLIQEAQRLRRRGRAMTLLVVLGIAAALGVMALSAGCAPRAAGAPAYARTETEQTGSTVRIERVCSDGSRDVLSSASGTVIAPGVVLTAYHVVDVHCPDGYAFVGYRIYERNADGEPFFVGLPRWADPGHDLAELRVPGAAPRGTLKIAHPYVGMRVCGDVAAPARGRACGEITGMVPRALSNGSIDIEMTVLAIPGNSGSGLYDERGRLVGVITNKTGCANDPALSCGGMASSVAGRLP